MLGNTTIACARKMGEGSAKQAPCPMLTSMKPRETTLATQMNVEPMTPVTCLARLGRHSLIARQPDSTERRAKIVQLTRHAQPTLEQVLRITRKV
jgi:DNA-binding MarR family transcriptional regulator